jgi:hypothetical protein
LLALPGCSNQQPIVAPVENEILVARDYAQSLDARIEVGTGDLYLRAGPCPLFKADAHYDASRGQPKIDYWVDDEYRGKLTIKADGEGRAFTKFDGCLTDELPTSLWLDHKYGNANLELGELQLELLELNLEGGDAVVDLVGRRYRAPLTKHRITMSDGDLTLRVPKAVGVKIEVEGMSTNVKSDLLKTDEGHYVNRAWGTTPVQIEILLQTGSDNVEILAR